MRRVLIWTGPLITILLLVLAGFSYWLLGTTAGLRWALVTGTGMVGGEVSGDVICIGAEVEIGPQAAVGRDLIVIGGTLRRDAASRVGGHVYDVRSRRGMRQVAA